MQTITVSELAVIDDAAIIDVREPDEFERANVAGSRNVPMSTLADHIDEIPHGRPAYLLCASGMRSARVAVYLDAEGFDVVNVVGGITEWHERGLPLESEAV